MVDPNEIKDRLFNMLCDQARNAIRYSVTYRTIAVVDDVVSQCSSQIWHTLSDCMDKFAPSIEVPDEYVYNTVNAITSLEGNLNDMLSDAQNEQALAFITSSIEVQAQLLGAIKIIVIGVYGDRIWHAVIKEFQSRYPC